jgi:predicted acyl esterase
MSRRIARTLTALSALVLLAIAPAAARAADVPEGAVWSEATIPSTDGTQLHADILKPTNLPAGTRTPVILSIGPYFNHSGQVGAAGPIEDASYEPVDAPTGPSDRFLDLVKDAHLMEKGYTFVMVDLRGFGGSTGCLDWGGPGEQADVKAAVEWAADPARNDFTNGRVGMYGKSYDGLTGLIGAALQPKGLQAVVSQEPVYDLYRYLYSNGVRYANSVGTPALYGAIAGTPGPLLGQPDYLAASLQDTQRPGCPVLNVLDQQSDDHESDYWKQRNFIDRVKGSQVPVFLTQGFLENNTKPDGAFETFNNLAGPKRAWFGMWDHVRGNDVDQDDRLLMGRKGWFDEVMRWYDHFLKDAPAPTDPPVVVQTSDGSYRAEQAWPPADAKAYTSPLKGGEYTDDAQNEGTGSAAGNGLWTISRPLPHDAHLAGIPKLRVDVTTSLPRANLTADVYDIDAQNSAVLISRGTTRVDQSGTVDLDLLGDDWKLPAGHRVGVLLSSSNSEWWLHVPTLQTVTLENASISLPWLSRARTERIQGDRSVRLDDYMDSAPFTVDAATIAENESGAFVLPPAMTAADGPAPAGTPSGAGTPGAARAGTPSAPSATTGAARTAAAPSRKAAVRKAAAKRVTLAVTRRGSRLVVRGKAPSGSRLVVRLKRGGRTVLTRRVTARNGAFTVTLPAARRTARYTVSVTGASGASRVLGSRAVR